MEIENNKLILSYRQSYNKIRPKKLNPKAPIDMFEILYISATERDLELYLEFRKGLSPEQFKYHFLKISKNLPCDNVITMIQGPANQPMCFAHHSICDGDSVFSNHIYTNTTDEVTYLSLACLSNLCDDLNRDDVYVAKEIFSHTNKRTGREITNDLVYVCREQEIKYRYPKSNFKLDWKHSWSVFGHWRRVGGIGKNKEGERCVIGKTWVIPCIKGAGKFKQKTRFVS